MINRAQQPTFANPSASDISCLAAGSLKPGEGSPKVVRMERFWIQSCLSLFIKNYLHQTKTLTKTKQKHDEHNDNRY